MGGVIVSAIYSEQKEMFLTDTNDIIFEDNIQNAKLFEDSKSARSELSSRFISLSYWVFNQKDLNEISICHLNDENKIIRRERYL